ncbi:RNA 2'-phosphotransferase [Hyphomonas sp. WL0036]|uniref:RNA 2'-phosphotransferase n=1 Tax=Hyphomonas sediminis TaxID=2866160 RepID=UPI001C801EB2|nr:RNA 2'-phosphotransferase [Hyphomonas sediminis]MBY9067097.1 RNA 2'-phosphotransferase [Hyphomonas sediminis]
MITDTQISKTLSYWLRHRPDAAGMELSPEGWADVDLVLGALAREELAVGWERLLQVVDTNDKSRFELSADGQMIRARQGHSVNVEGSWAQAVPPPVLFHGTVERFWPAIAAEGLRPMQRHHVHLSADIETAQRVGQRRGAPIILEVDAAGLLARGGAFFLTSNNVWLVDAVPPEFLKRAG